MSLVYVENTNVLELHGLKSAVDDTPINDAIISFTLRDCDGNEVNGQSWPTPMIYIEASEGDYRAVLEHDLDLRHAAKYTAIVEINAGPERIGHYEFPIVPKRRTSS